MMSVFQLLLAVCIVALGTAVQASVGFGLAMVAAPLLYLIDPAFVPGPLIACALLLSVWIAWQERNAIDFSYFRAAVAGRLIGSPLAALLLGSLSAVAFDLVFGSMVLLAVVLSVVHPRIKLSNSTIFVATLLSGLMGTLSSIGGPPLALVYQHERGPALRANLSMLFLMGTVISIASLFLVGRFGSPELTLSALLGFGIIPGVLLSRPLKRHMDSRSVRPYLLMLCALSAATVLFKGLYDLLG